MMQAFLVYSKLFKESTLMAFQAILVNKLRTLLSVLGITIGIFAIVLVGTIVESMEKNVMKSFETLGRDVIYIQKWPWTFSDNYPWWKYMNRPKNRINEALELQERLKENPYVKQVAHMVKFMGKNIKNENSSMNGISGIAVSSNYQEVNVLKIADGRYFSEIEAEQGREVIILGNNVAQNIFNGYNPLGEDVIFFGKKFFVIGVFEKKGKSILGDSEDDMVMMPIKTLTKISNLNTGFNEPSIMVKAAEGVSLEDVELQIQPTFRAIRRLKPTDEDNFSLNRITMLTKVVESIFSVLNKAGTIIGLFALLVGGFGIANIMFVSVKERTSQIGIQKALGAKNIFILFQFLTESVVLCLIGGLIGITAVYLVSVAAKEIMDFELFLSRGNFIYGCVVSISIGIAAGFIPAWQASKLKPVDAIRSKI